jgi:hypothetical protein
MATDGTWTGSVLDYLDYTDLDNWLGGAAYANGTGATITLAPADDSYIPTTNRPSTVTDVFHFIIASNVTVTLDNWLNGALIGNVTVNHEGAATSVTCVAAITGTATVTDGVLVANGNLNGAVTVAAPGDLYCDGSLTIGGAVTNNGHFFIGGAFAIICTGLFTNNGTGIVNAPTGSTIDFNGGVTGGGTWGLGINSKLTLTSSGDFNLTSATWNVAAGSTLTMDLAGTLNLGTASVPNLAIDIKANTTLGASMACYGFTLTSGALSVSNKTITVGAGGFTDNGGTCTAEQLNIVCAATTGVAKWPTATDILKSLTIDSGATVTASGHIATAALALNGTLAMGASYDCYIFTDGDNFWTQGASGSITGTRTLDLRIYAARTNASAIIWGGTGPFAVYSSGGSYSLTLAGKLTTAGSLALYGASGLTSTLALNGGCDITGAVALGTGTTQSGALTLAAGQVHTLRSTLARSGTGTANALNLAGIVNVGGDQTWTGIAVTLAASTVIKATAAVKIDGTLAAAEARTNTNADVFSDGAGKVLTLKDLAISGALLRAWCGCELSGTVTGVQNLPGPPDDY